ncbi:hypothetical protein ACHHYP_05709 [Achlya hypogyna]|uniref:Small integral membrane protein 15 n=1 Tax=Achlya hypogyna TaxID=1202772 RepID=A0A1V9YWX0_ACHHY|nr:hypothetical protein ACHHYP_05709 [Achlya hypogyna]
MEDLLQVMAKAVQEDPTFWASVLAAAFVPLFIVALLAAKSLIDSIDEDEKKQRLEAAKKRQ